MVHFVVHTSKSKAFTNFTKEKSLSTCHFKQENIYRAMLKNKQIIVAYNKKYKDNTL